MERLEKIFDLQSGALVLVPVATEFAGERLEKVLVGQRLLLSEAELKALEGRRKAHLTLVK